MTGTYFHHFLFCKRERRPLIAAPLQQDSYLTQFNIAVMRMTCFGTFLADFGTFFTMFMLVFSAFIGAMAACFFAEGQKFVTKLTVPNQQLGSQEA